MRIGSILLIVLAGCASLPAYVPGSERVLIGGPENSIRIEMVQAAEKGEQPAFFVRITGTDREYDGYVLRYTVDTTDPERHVWSTTIWGRDAKHLIKTRADTDDPLYVLRWRDHGERSEFSWTPGGTFDVEEMLRARLDQTEAIDRLRAFDRQREIERLTAMWNEDLAEVNDNCETKLAGDIAWETATDEALIQPRLGCQRPLRPIAQLCHSYAEVRRSIGALERVACRLGSELSIAIEGKTLVWTVTPDWNSDISSEIKRAIENVLPWPEGPLAPRMHIESTFLCTDGGGQVVGLDPQPWETSRVIYLHDGTWRRARRAEGSVDNGYFYDPRFFNATAEPLRQRLSVVAADEKRCWLRCGEQVTELDHVGEATKMKLLLGKAIEPAPVPRRPYGLARDREGVYYFVDVGPQTDDRDFRVFAGRKGAMEQLDMVDLVTDSGGDIFVTRSGKLRLILGKETSYWIEGKRSTDLINLPVEDNLLVIYNQLGVYLGQPYGTPCDIF